MRVPSNYAESPPGIVRAVLVFCRFQAKFFARYHTMRIKCGSTCFSQLLLNEIDADTRLISLPTMERRGKSAAGLFLLFKGLYEVRHRQCPGHVQLIVQYLKQDAVLSANAVKDDGIFSTCSLSMRLTWRAGRVTTDWPYFFERPVWLIQPVLALQHHRVG